MNFEIFGKALPMIRFDLEKGESVYTQTGSMFFKSSNVSMKTISLGNTAEDVSNVITGDTIFVTEYSSLNGDGEITFTGELPGEMITVAIDKSRELIIQKNAFLCAPKEIKLDMEVSKKLSADLINREGFILQRVSGQGTAFLMANGNAIIRTLNHGETLDVSPGNIVGFDSTVKFSIDLIPGIKNMLFGEEGYFFIQLTGPGKVILQTQNFTDLVEHVGKILATKLGSKIEDSDGNLGAELVEKSLNTAVTKVTESSVIKLLSRF